MLIKSKGFAVGNQIAFYLFIEELVRQNQLFLLVYDTDQEHD